jgi:hypothetical protein
MSLRTDMLALKDDLGTLLSPSELDQAVHQLTIVTRTWAGGAVDAPVTSGPAYTDASLVLPQKYVIRPVGMKEIDESGGRYKEGDVVVLSIVPNDPANGSIGYTPDQLAPVIVQGQEVIYRITGNGPSNGEYALRELRQPDVYSYDLVLSRRLTTPELP